MMDIGRWRQLMDSHGFGENRETYDRLVAAYSARGRFYHNQEHVTACLSHLDNVDLQVDSKREVEVALWFHDAVYSPFSSSNEEDSADWAAKFVSDCGASKEQQRRIHQLIMVTKHDAPTKTDDEAILVDIDLSILGAKPAVYNQFEEGVRKEYRRVPFFIYRKKRAEILRGFLGRSRIYTSDVFPEERDWQARENIENAISRLQ